MSDRKSHIAARHGARVHLRVTGSLAATFAFRPGVPKTRGDCKDAPRPCPYIMCTKHGWLIEQSDRPGNPDKHAQGGATFYPVGHSCKLDVADAGPRTRQQTGDEMDITDKRVEQIEKGALAKLDGLNEDQVAELAAALLAPITSRAA